MVTSLSSTGLDSSVLLSYYNSQVTTSVTSALNTLPSSATASTSSATSADNPPWSTYSQPAQQLRDAQVLGITNFLDTSNVPKSAGATDSTKTEQDNQKLFSLYTAVNNLSYLAKMSQRDTATDGQRVGYDTRFQAGLAQVQNYIKTNSFNDFTLQLGKTQSSVTSGVSVPFAPFTYPGGTIVADANISNALNGISTSDSFNIAVKKGGTTTNVAINFANISGPLTIDNIVNYANQQLSAAGFTSRLSRTMTVGTINDPTKSSYGISISQAPSESLNFSSAGATPSLYLAGNSGSALATSTASGSKTYTTAADQQGRLVKLSDLSSGTPTSTFNATLSPDTGNTTTSSTAVDSNGNVYTIGTATGSFGNELNQGSQDVVLTKYDSAGNLQWSKLLGSAGNADAYSMAIDSSNNLVVAGSTTANLTPTGIANGNADSFVAKYDANGNQTWVKQIPTLADNGANSVSVDATGNIYVGGQVTGVIGTGQTNNGGTDGYVAKLDSDGQITYEQQLGTSGTDSVAATAVAAERQPVVASVQNGQAILSKYANGDATTAPVWQENLGTLGNGGSIGGIAVSNGKVYLSGTSSNGALTSSGQASVVSGTSGGLDAFVAGFTDSGSTVNQDTVTYIGTGSTDTAGKLTVDSSGTVYLSGTTSGTFAGQTRNATGTQNAFVTALNSSGNVTWTRQFGGASGTSTGAAVAIDQTGSSVLDKLGTAARHHRYQPVGGSDLRDDAQGRKFLPDQGRQGHSQLHRHHRHRCGRDLAVAGQQDQQRHGVRRQGERDLCQWRQCAEDRSQQGCQRDADRRSRRSRCAGPARDYTGHDQQCGRQFEFEFKLVQFQRQAGVRSWLFQLETVHRQPDRRGHGAGRASERAGFDPEYLSDHQHAGIVLIHDCQHAEFRHRTSLSGGADRELSARAQFSVLLRKRIAAEQFDGQQFLAARRRVGRNSSRRWNFPPPVSARSCVDLVQMVFAACRFKGHGQFF